MKNIKVFTTCFLYCLLFMMPSSRLLSQSTSSDWFEKGLAATDLMEKIRCYDKAIQLDPDGADVAYNNRGYCKQQLHQDEEAILDFNKSIAIDPKFAGAYDGRAISRINLNQFDEALKDLSKAISLKPDYVLFYQQRGSLYFNLAQYQQAVKDFSKMIQLLSNKIDKGLHDENSTMGSEQINALQSELANAFFYRGKALSQLGQLEDAKKDFQISDRLIAMRHRIFRQ